MAKVMRPNHITDIKTPIQNRNLQRFVVSTLAILLATIVREWPLGALELRIPWVTFYPAVMAAALFGGLSSGMYATVLSVLVVLFWSPTNLPFIDDSGDWLGLAVFSVNGTLIALMSGAMHRAQKQATEAKEEAESANKAKSTFLANMSHELRTPLNAILGFTNVLIKASDSTPGQIKKLTIISNSGENLLNLINNVLDISKIEAGHMVKENTDFNLENLMIEIQSMMQVKTEEKNLDFHLIMAPELPKHITTDSGKLRQILINLIGNAIKYTDDGAITLEVELAKSTNTEMALINFKVKDSGKGIRSKDQQNIFNPFKQTGSQPDTEPGTGLGLTICSQFIQLLGGTICVTSDVGKGSDFNFSIPVISVNESIPIQPKQFLKRVVGLTGTNKIYRILIAEDKLENRLLLQSLLEPLGMEIREASNGQEAVEQCRTWIPDLIWMDIRMPIMDGMEATRIIKASPACAHTKIVALTAHAMEKERLRILEAGCDQFIRKPYRDTEIFHAMTKHLDVHFLYADKPIQSQLPNEYQITEIQLEKIPTSLVNELHDAALKLNGNACLKVAQTIGSYDQKLGICISSMAEDLQFREILTALEALTIKESQ